MPRLLLQLAMFIALVVPAHADWVVSRVRGDAQQMVDGQWVPLVRGAVVVDGQSVRTGENGHVDLVRDAELIELDPETEILLHEGAGKLTSLVQSSGVVTADVERRNVQHFSIQTPFLAAVVKGTRFRVVVADGSAQVNVDRGTVQVQDTINDLVVDIVRGQEAQVSNSAPLEVSGPGRVAVFTFDGEHVVNGTKDVPADANGRPANSAAANAGGSGNGNANGPSNGNGGGNGNGNSGQGNGNGGGNGNGNGGQGNGNSGGTGNGNSGQGNGNGGGNGNGNSGQGNGSSGGNGGGNSGQGNGNGGGNRG